MDLNLSSPHTVAIDGSLYERLPGFSERIKKRVNETLGNKQSPLEFCLVKDGSGIGAAIAAAMNNGN
jgi:hexokinase